MATTKHASIRYEVLDSHLQKESEDNTQENLREWCCNELSERDDQYEMAEVSLRTFRSDISELKKRAAKHDVNIVIKLGRKGYYYYYDREGYSIFNNELSDSEVGQLKCAMQLLTRFKGLPEYDSIASIGAKLEKKYKIAAGGQTYVEYEHVQSTGEEIMADMCNFIIKQQPIRITYMPYGKPEKEWILHPYLLKEYNNRWFLFGYNETEDRISNAPLDRIRADYEAVPNSFIPNTFIDFSTYFDNVVGVTVRDADPTAIILKATPTRYPYIESKPLHHSQTVINHEECIFTIDVIPNNELDSLILSYGGDVEVISPEWYRERIKRKVSELGILYFGGQDNCTLDALLCNMDL